MIMYVPTRGLLSVKFTSKSERGKEASERAGSLELSLTETFNNYVLHDLWAPSKFRLWARKVLVKGRDRLSGAGTHCWTKHSLLNQHSWAANWMLLHMLNVTKKVINAIDL